VLNNIITFLRSIVWTSTISLILAIVSLLLVLISTPDFFPVALILGLASISLATLSKGN
jgi:hypothetical protein